MRKIIAGVLTVCLLLMGCGGPDNTPTATEPASTPTGTEVAATPTATPETAATPTATPEEAELSILYINVGYGDAALIRAGGKTYMVDTGKKEAVPALYRALAMLGVTHLDGLFLTHTHSDHIGGAAALALRCDIGTLYTAKISMDKKSGKNALDEVGADIGLTRTKLSAGDTVYVADGVYFEVLGPISYNGDDDNDNSLVMKLHAGGVTVLLTGDMQFAEEASLMAAGTDLTADALKVGNHGNPDATSEAFANAVGAQVAVISTSTAEDDDTPNDRVLDALSGAQIYVSQNYACGVLLTATGGVMELSGPLPQTATADIAIQSIDKDAQTITLVNNGADADLSGYFIWSVKGSEVFVFPQGAFLAAGDTLTVACRNGEGDFIWDEKKVWSDKDDEMGILYDANGNELSRLA